MDPTAQCERTESTPHRAAQPALSAHSCAAGERPGGAQRARQSSCRWAMSARGGWRRQHAESAAEEALHSTPRDPRDPRAQPTLALMDKDRPEHSGVDNLAAGGDAAEARLPAAARRHAPRWGRAAGDGAREGQRQPEHVDAPRKRRAPVSAANASSSSSWPRAGRRTRSASTARSRPSDETSQLRLSLSRAGLHRNVHRSRGRRHACRLRTGPAGCAGWQRAAQGSSRVGAQRARGVDAQRSASRGRRPAGGTRAGMRFAAAGSAWHEPKRLSRARGEGEAVPTGREREPCMARREPARALAAEALSLACLYWPPSFI